MASPPSIEPNDPTPELAGYFAASRDPAVALVAVVPLWLVYQGLRLELAPEERNGAEALVTDSVALFGPRALLVLELVLGALVLLAIGVVLRRKLPWGRIAGVAAIEGSVLGFLLGPLSEVLTRVVLEGAPLRVDVSAPELVGALGAGLFEEAVFRLLLLSLASLLLTRAANAFGLPRATGVVAAVFLSALVFSWFHHVGPAGEPFHAPVFAFRAIAGVVLGAIFVVRGFAVVVYAHAAYDVHYFLTHD
ncbi:MAG: CPBP family intramembrane metalloprotease [Planctomycetes bacterium]|nr:CPBP family intramembrane metalloprotease [Planctomycetota bacterium]